MSLPYGRTYEDLKTIHHVVKKYAIGSRGEVVSPHILIVDTSNIWDIRHFLADRKTFCKLFWQIRWKPMEKFLVDKQIGNAL